MNISVLQFWIMIVDSKLILMVEFYNILWFSLSDFKDENESAGRTSASNAFQNCD